MKIRSAVKGIGLLLLQQVCVVGSVAAAGGWCYQPGACEAWLFKGTIDEMKAALFYVGWPANIDLPEKEPAAFWSEKPVDGLDFIPGDPKTPPHRAERPSHEIPVTLKDGLYDLGHIDIGLVEVRTKDRPKLFVGESAAEARNDDFRWFEQDTEMVNVGEDRWRSRYPLALRCFRFFTFGSVSEVRFRSQVPQRKPVRRIETSDARARRIWEIGVNTLNVCTRTFFLDAVKRDRMPWAGDFVVACAWEGDAHVADERVLDLRVRPPSRMEIDQGLSSV